MSEGDFIEVYTGLRLLVVAKTWYVKYATFKFCYVRVLFQHA